MLTSMVQFDLC